METELVFESLDPFQLSSAHVGSFEYEESLENTEKQVDSAFEDWQLCIDLGEEKQLSRQDSSNTDQASMATDIEQHTEEESPAIPYSQAVSRPQAKTAKRSAMHNIPKHACVSIKRIISLSGLERESYYLCLQKILELFSNPKLQTRNTLTILYSNDHSLATSQRWFDQINKRFSSQNILESLQKLKQLTLEQITIQSIISDCQKKDRKLQRTEELSKYLLKFTKSLELGAISKRLGKIDARQIEREICRIKEADSCLTF